MFNVNITRKEVNICGCLNLIYNTTRGVRAQHVFPMCENCTREASSMEKVETKKNKHAVKCNNKNCSDSLVLISSDGGGAVMLFHFLISSKCVTVAWSVAKLFFMCKVDIWSRQVCKLNTAQWNNANVRYSNTHSFLCSCFLGKYKQRGNLGHLTFFGLDQGEVHFCR